VSPRKSAVRISTHDLDDPDKSEMSIAMWHMIKYPFSLSSARLTGTRVLPSRVLKRERELRLLLLAKCPRVVADPIWLPLSRALNHVIFRVCYVIVHNETNSNQAYNIAKNIYRGFLLVIRFDTVIIAYNKTNSNLVAIAALPRCALHPSMDVRHA
jgi:hypothetical protein